MAQLELIRYTSYREDIDHNRNIKLDGDGNVIWVTNGLGSSPIDDLPTIFWSNGEAWHEANHFPIEKVMSKQGRATKTALSLMKHLAAYASWLKSKELDWRHFPVRREERSLVKFRGYLID